MRKPFNQDFPLTQGFGGNEPMYRQYNLKGHNGLDYGLPTGTEVVAPHSGKILEVADQGKSGYGKYIKVENDKEGSVLAHLSAFKVKAGDIVTEGQLLGLSGNTGNSTGPHLHWGYYQLPRDRANGYAGFIDQTPFLKEKTTQQVAVDGETFQRLVANSTKYDEFNSAGYTTVQDVLKKVEELSKEKNAVVEDLRRSEERNSLLAEELQKISQENGSAIDESYKAQKERDEMLKNYQKLEQMIITKDKEIETLKEKNKAKNKDIVDQLGLVGAIKLVVQTITRWGREVK